MFFRNKPLIISVIALLVSAATIFFVEDTTIPIAITAVLTASVAGQVVRLSKRDEKQE